MTSPPPLLQWRVDSRSAAAGMRVNTVFVRIVRMESKFEIHFTFPLPRGVKVPSLRTESLETAKLIAEDLFGKWLLAVHLTPPEGMKLPTQRMG